MRRIYDFEELKPQCYFKPKRSMLSLESIPRYISAVMYLLGLLLPLMYVLSKTHYSKI